MAPISQIPGGNQLLHNKMCVFHCILTMHRYSLKPLNEMNFFEPLAIILKRAFFAGQRCHVVIFHIQGEKGYIYSRPKGIFNQIDASTKVCSLSLQISPKLHLSSFFLNDYKCGCKPLDRQ